MPTKHTWEAATAERLWSSVLAIDKALTWIHRPIWLHADNNTGTPCPCCGSRTATIVDEWDHLDLLLSKQSNTRSLKQKHPDQDEWQRFAEEHGQKFTVPLRAYQKQLDAILARPKIKLISGGVGGGKSEIGSNDLADEWMLHGGQGADLWWVAPEIKHLEIALRKLFLGDFRDGSPVPPLFPKQVVLSHPTKTTQKDLRAHLIDGTQIRFWHAGNEGHFKGFQPQIVIFDEGAEVKSHNVYGQLRERLMRSGGRMVIPTTPKMGSPCKEIYDEGTPLEEWDGSYATKVHAQLTSFDNPWIDDQWIEDHIKTHMRGDETRIRREIYGEWIGDGLQLWRLYDPRVHIRRGVKFDDLGLVDVTKLASKRLFRRSHPQSLVAGMDFNLNPMSLEMVRFGCPKGLDTKDIRNWIVVSTDELVEKANVHQFADMMLDADLHGLHIQCDPSGAQRNGYQIAHNVNESSTLAAEVEHHGFVCQPAHRSKKGNPKTPPILDRLNILHKLMSDRLVDKDGNEWPRYIVLADDVPRLIQSFEAQESDDEGKPAKEPGDAQDRLAGPTDALTYLLWATFRTDYTHKTVDWDINASSRH